MNNYLLIFFISFLTISCLEENLQPINISYNNSLDVINYAESNGDFINSPNNPALISVDSLNQNLSSAIILDIRNSSEFAEGHIPNAISITPENVFGYIESISQQVNEFIVIVSRSGQKAAYICSLLRIYGMDNVFSLDYGMGYWHEQFSNIWIDNKSNSIYARKNYLTRKKSSLKLSINYETPSLQFESESKTTKENLRNRINNLIVSYELNSVISVSNFDARFNPFPQNYGYPNNFIICYDHEILNDYLLFNAHNMFVHAIEYYDNFGNKAFNYVYTSSPVVRPHGTFFYNGQTPSYDFRSDKKLFTLPTKKEILIYSYNGQRSAYITAYLNLIGYNAKFIEFGAHAMMSYYYISYNVQGNKKYNNYEIVESDSPFSKYAFNKMNIRNYSVVQGN